VALPGAPLSPAALASASPSTVGAKGERREKSLGLLSQKFVMLFLVSPTKVVSAHPATSPRSCS
jgi:hypothetical protein